MTSLGNRIRSDVPRRNFRLCFPSDGSDIPDKSDNWGPAIHNTWIGDPNRLIILDSILKTVEEENLCESISHVGDYIRNNLHVLANEFNISNIRGRVPLTGSVKYFISVLGSRVRGLGGFLAWDMNSTTERDAVIIGAMRNGLILGPCGLKSLRLRPSLTFDFHHADELIHLLRKTLS